MHVAARLDDIGKPAWITLIVLGFIFFWPIGLMILAYVIGSGRMGSWRHGGRWGQWRGCAGDHPFQAAERWMRGSSRGSGNSAFDEYRAETLRRLEDEQRDFQDFLRQLRKAKDKAEFDEFLAERRRRTEEGPAPQPQS